MGHRLDFWRFVGRGDSEKHPRQPRIASATSGSLTLVFWLSALEQRFGVFCELSRSAPPRPRTTITRCRCVWCPGPGLRRRSQEGLALRLSRPYASYHITGHLLSKPQMRLRRSFRFRLLCASVLLTFADSSTRSPTHLRREYIRNADNNIEKRWLCGARELIFDIHSCRSSSNASQVGSDVAVGPIQASGIVPTCSSRMAWNRGKIDG